MNRKCRRIKFESCSVSLDFLDIDAQKTNRITGEEKGFRIFFMKTGVIVFKFVEWLEICGTSS